MALTTSCQANPARPRHTYRDYAALPEGAPYQLVEGELLMTPSPVALHQRLSGSLFVQLCDWVKGSAAGEVFIAPFDVIFDDENVLQPDLLFVSRERSSIVQDFCRGAPDLVVEVLSPSTASLDRSRKLRTYSRFGVARVWLIDPAEQTFECLLLDGATYRIEVTFAGEEVAEPPGFPGLRISLAQVWPAPSAPAGGR